MNVRYTQHALRKMAERGIDEGDVEMALRHPIAVPQPGDPGKVVIEGHAAGGRILKVCVLAADQEMVVTAYWA